MNIATALQYNPEKPAILPIHKSDKINLFAVGLLKGQQLPKHTTRTPTLLTVLRGSIQFSIQGENLTLNTLDTYSIPVDTEHDVTGLDDCIFTLLQEK
ncbi:MAG: hypothetical protein IPL65_00860 [Lewinellaceae bacterium]|nr:hypothetical protein [Lewinellaceae bacterium]